MANVRKITLPDSSTLNIVDSRLHVYRNATGTAAVTATPFTSAKWDVTDNQVTAYEDGMIVCVKVPVAGNATYGTVFQINNLGYKPVVYNVNSGISTRYSVGGVVWAVYNSTQTASGYLNSASASTITGCWQVMDYDANSTYTEGKLYLKGGKYVANSAIYRYELLFQVDENTLTPLNNVSNKPTTTTKAILTNVEFDPFGLILYYNSTTTFSANNAAATTYLAWVFDTVDLRYTFNISDSVNPLITDKNVYLKVSPQNNGKVKLASATPLVQTLPSTNDGYWYILLGRAYSYYQMALYAHHPVYYYNGTEIAEVLKPSQEASIESLMPTKVSDLQNDAGYTTNVGTVTGSSLTANNIILGNGSSAIKSSGKTIATTLGTDDTTVPTSKAVKDVIDALPEPMIFKGTLGTGGTITSLPAAAAGNTGYTYKVITNGTYQSIAAKDGDTFISNGSSWTLIPSGDEPSGTVTNVEISNGGGLSVSGSPITSSGTITISHADTSSQASVNNSGRTYIQDITLDEYGHVTGISSATETVTNTDTSVTAEANHYTPTADSGSELTAVIDGTAGSFVTNTEYTVLTGVKAQRDSKGHVTGLTYTAQKVKDTTVANTDTKVRQYQAGANAAGSGTKYPLLSRYALTNKNGSYDANYARFHTGATVDTSTGNIEAPAFIKTEGTSSQFLKADGSVDTNTYQKALVSGTNIKTINGNSILTSGNLNLLDANKRYQMPTNPFGGSNTAIHQNLTNDGFYSADQRFTVTLTGFTNNTSVTAAKLFDGNYETNAEIATGGTGIILIESNTPLFGTYNYGFTYLSFYYTGVPQSASMRIYGTKSGVEGWYDAGSSTYYYGTSDSTTSVVLQLYNGSVYNAKKFEITIVAKSDIACKVTQIDHMFTRGSSNYMSAVTKFPVKQDLWGDIEAPSFIKRGGTSSQFLKADGSVDSNTYVTSSTIATMTQTEVTNTINTIFS